MAVRAGLRNRCPKGRESSSLSSGTNGPVAKLVVRAGLKIQWTAMSVPVRLRPGPQNKSLYGVTGKHYSLLKSQFRFES